MRGYNHIHHHPPSLVYLSIYINSAADLALPFQIEDASRPDSEAEDPNMPSVGLDNRLNFRWIDTRTQANQAIFRVQHAVSLLFREVGKVDRLMYRLMYASSFIPLIHTYIHTHITLPTYSS